MLPRHVRQETEFNRYGYTRCGRCTPALYACIFDTLAQKCQVNISFKTQSAEDLFYVCNAGIPKSPAAWHRFTLSAARKHSICNTSIPDLNKKKQMLNGPNQKPATNMQQPSARERLLQHRTAGTSVPRNFRFYATSTYFPNSALLITYFMPF